MDDPEAPLLSTVPPTWTTILTPITSLSPLSRLLLFALVFTLILINFCFFRLAAVLNRDPIYRRPRSPSDNPPHLLIVLGSGGHTAEMLNILGQYRRLQHDWPQRTYVVSSGDDFSASKAREFENNMSSKLDKGDPSGGGDPALLVGPTATGYDIITVHRARRVHQTLLTTPLSSLRCLWDCIKLLRGTHPDFCPRIAGDHSSRPSTPDLILTNGPGTGVIVILASIILLFFGVAGPSASLPRSKKVMKHDTGVGDASANRIGQMRSIYIESWARVRTLSLSGRLLKPLVDRFLVQWPQLVEKETAGAGARTGRVEFVGSLVT
ncbi:UDP-N-acetylglucosamine transferase subunit alg14 [Cladophialophora carrionii]|uniref:UDP-N-acetylglucosamine transferase subunit ALG14 n=1 Tax=Cladophialophora carrionii TaxID=86049 RepID=A0A1C1CUN0_9EURO|nr:UDP-N-acetylglucosamine transferase subunit alg14 [Cladophialophora carrionii]